MGQKITDRGELTTPEDDDLFVMVDVSDTTDSPEGTTKKATFATVTPVEGSEQNYAEDETESSNNTVTYSQKLNIAINVPPGEWTILELTSRLVDVLMTLRPSLNTTKQHRIRTSMKKDLYTHFVL